MTRITKLIEVLKEHGMGGPDVPPAAQAVFDFILARESAKSEKENFDKERIVRELGQLQRFAFQVSCTIAQEV